MSDEKPAEDAPPPVPGVEIFDNLAPVPVAPVTTPPEVAPSVEPRRPEPANPVLRAFAFVLDGVGAFVVTVIVVFAGLNADYGVAFGAILLVPALAAVLATVLTALFGFTPGKALLGLRVVDATTGGRPGWRAIIRSLVITAPLLLDLALAWTVGSMFTSDIGLTAFLVLPPVVWVGMLVVLIARRNDRYRGVQDLAARSVVVRVR